MEFSTSRNECFDFAGYKCIGFDMDHTFVNYKLNAVSRLIFGGLCEFVQREHGYPGELFANLDFTLDFCTKGRIFDVIKGNFINLTSDGMICCCQHGGGPPLSVDEIVLEYGAERRFEHFDEVCDLKRDLARFLPFNSAFGLPGAQLLGVLVDHVDSTVGDKRPNTYQKQVEHLFGGFAHTYDPGALEARRGVFFPAMADNPELYLEKVDESVLQLLRECRARGQKLLLMTNSRLDFTEVVLGYAVGEGWADLFDVVVTSATKPAFFGDGAEPMQRVKSKSGKEVLAFGNAETLKRETGIGADGPGSILYFGDDLNGDVAALQPVAGGAWHGVAIVEELGDNEHAREEHVFHCPKQDASVFDSYWYAKINACAQLCAPSVKEIARAQQSGRLNGCHVAGSNTTLWFPATPREVLLLH